MKKALSIFCVAILAMSMLACENANNEGSTADSITEPATESVVESSAEESAAESVAESSAEESTVEPAEESAPETLGSAQLSAGDVFQLENLKVTVDEIVKTAEPIMSDSDFEITPDEGNALVIIKYEVENTGSEADMLNMFAWEAYADDYQIGTEIQLFDIDGYSSSSSEIAPGKKAREYVCCQVPEDCSKLEITYDMFGDTFTWNLEFSE